MKHSKWKKQCLNGNWRLFLERDENAREMTSISQLTANGIKEIPGSVPGNFELDMMRAGMLPELFYGDNILLAQELEDMHLWYGLEFENTVGIADVFFCFEGIDTFSDIYLNGRLIGSTGNMFIEHIIKADGIKNGKNELVVHINPSVLEARKRENGVGAFGFLANNADTLSIRKAAHTSGWDIMPRIVSAGIWRDVFLFAKPTDGIDEIYAQTLKLEENKAHVHVYFKTHVSRGLLKNYSVKISGICGDSKFEYHKKLWHTEGHANIIVENPKLWWTRDFGLQNLYNVTVSLMYGDDVLDEETVRMGIRTVKLLRTDYTDENGNGEFCFVLNNEKLFVKGTNWVPTDALHSRDKERLPENLAMLLDIGCNMVRMWGGNVYENEIMYDFCDEHGIAIWQDFAMGCAIYPQNNGVCNELLEEAYSVIKKYRQHPALFLWAGDNECDCNFAQWEAVSKNPAANKLTREIIPSALQQCDPFREYLPSSPYISDKAYRSGNMDNTPEMHLWGPRKYYKADFYSKAIAHFASETGYHGCPWPSSVKRFISPEKLFPWNDNDQWLLHAACMEREGDQYAYRIPLMANQIKELFGAIPDDLEDFAIASQISQAEAVKFFIERFRWGKWRRTGIIWWNLIDGWPQFSDAVVDYYRNKKLAYEVIKRSQIPVCMLISQDPDTGALKLHLCNDTREPTDVEFEVKNIVTDETAASGKATVDANSRTEVCDILAEENGMLLISWTEGGCKHVNHFLTGKPDYDLKQVVEWYKQIGIYTGKEK